MPQTKFGGCKVAANKLGISAEQYLQNVKSGLKRCFSCRDWLPSDGFSRDRTTHDGKDNRCKSCRRVVDRQRYERILSELRKPRGFPPKPGRDGDKNQARARVNYAVTRNKLPHART